MTTDRSGQRMRQGGMGTLAILVILSLLVFFITLLFKLGPAYMNYMTVKSVMDAVASQPVPAAGAPREILSQIGKRLDINNVRGVANVCGEGAEAKPSRDASEISRLAGMDFKVRRNDDKSYAVTVNYQQCEHLFFNIDALMTFAYAVDVKSQ